MHAVILDVDGTLLESAAADERLYLEAVAEILGEIRIRSDMNEYDPVTDTGILEQIAADNGLPFDAELEENVRRAFVDRVTGHIAEFGPFAAIPGAPAFLERLHRSPLADSAIATGGWGATARLKLESAGFRIENQPIVSSDDATERTEIMRVALDSLAGPYDDVIYLGDGAWDRRATAELGWTFQPVGRRLGGVESFDDLAGLPAWRWLFAPG